MSDPNPAAIAVTDTYDASRLDAALEEVNQALHEFLEKHGDSVEVRPFANFNLEMGTAYFTVSIATGRKRLGRDPRHDRD